MFEAPTTQLAPDHRAIVPYITSWSTERKLTRDLVERRGTGLAYVDECVTDRDDHGVLWLQVACRPQQGRPLFGNVHPLRQRRAMRRLLCQVCAAPADKTEDGVLWLLIDHRNDWPNWPEKMAVTEPPVCARCVSVASRLCPVLREGAVSVRVRHCPITGVRGMLHHRDGRDLVATHEDNVHYDDPIVRWMLATNLLRELRDCTLVDLEDACPS
jgi:hypothetical protein